MTTVSAIAMTAVRRLMSLRKMAPNLAVGASIAAVFKLVQDAHKSAYVDPYFGPIRPQKSLSNEGLEGRDCRSDASKNP